MEGQQAGFDRRNSSIHKRAFSETRKENLRPGMKVWFVNFEEYAIGPVDSQTEEIEYSGTIVSLDEHMATIQGDDGRAYKDVRYSDIYLDEKNMINRNGPEIPIIEPQGLKKVVRPHSSSLPGNDDEYDHPTEDINEFLPRGSSQSSDTPQPGDTIVVGRDITVGRVMSIKGGLVHLRTLEGEMTMPVDKLYRAASKEYPDFNQLKDITIRAMTSYTDMASTARAAHLMGETTRQFWTKTIARIKKECGAAIEADVKHLCKWGTVRPSVAAVKDVIMKHMQAQGVYPYPELVVGLIAAMPNPLQDRLIGPEGSWPISEPR